MVKLALALGLLTFLIYYPTVGYTFVNYDDDVFVTNNRYVAPGFTWEGVKWAFTSTEIDYWRPLSWLTHMLDMELYGPVGGMHHLTNVLIHCSATIMLLFALHALTSAVWRSALVAALFAWHPLHVESVAWVAERKDVLCGFFWFYTMWAYASHVQHPTSRSYLSVLLGFVCGMMSKPMIVTLPCALLLLDVWPLRRIKLGGILNEHHRVDRHELMAISRQVLILIREKLPLFVIIVALSISTFIAQREVGTMNANIPLFARMGTATLGYLTYMQQTIFPDNLCVLYPIRVNFVPIKWISALLLLCVLSARAIIRINQFSYYFVGWFWFIGTLVPVIGLVQVGEQSHADRYTYIPLVGLFICAAWGLGDFIQKHPNQKRLCITGVVVGLILCVTLTRIQLPHWEDSAQLFKRVIEVDPKTVTGYLNLSGELNTHERYQESAQYLEKALTIGPTAGIYFNLAVCYCSLGKSNEAQLSVIKGLSVESDHKESREWLHIISRDTVNQSRLPLERRTSVHTMLASGWAALNEYQRAVEELERAAYLSPKSDSIKVDLAAYHAILGNETSARAILEDAIAINATNYLAHSNLGALLAKSGQLKSAIQHYHDALLFNPTNSDTRHNLGIALLRSGKSTEAIAEFEKVLKSKPDFVPSLQQMTWVLATYPECQNPERAQLYSKRLMSFPPTPLAFDAAAAAAAVNGRFDEAIKLANQGIELARASKQTTVEGNLREHLALFRSGKIYTTSQQRVTE